MRPTLDITAYFAPNGRWTTRGLVDTGSQLTIFDRGAADGLGVKIGYAGAETGYTRILGGRWPLQFEYVDLCLAKDPAFEWTARVAFVTDPGYQPPFQVILGSRGFLDRWSVTFNYYNNFFVLQSPDQGL